MGTVIAGPWTGTRSPARPASPQGPVLVDSNAALRAGNWAAYLERLLNRHDQAVIPVKRTNVEMLARNHRELEGWLTRRQDPRRPRPRPGSSAWVAAERAERLAADRAKWDAQKAAWRSVTREQREKLVLEQLGDERLTITELVERMGQHLPECNLHDGAVRPIVARLYQRGELRRSGETFRKTRTRYRYFRSLEKA